MTNNNKKFSENQEKILYQILEETSKNGESVRSLNQNMSALTDRYIVESEYRDKRISTLETRVDRLSLIISAALFIVTTVFVVMVGYLFTFM